MRLVTCLIDGEVRVCVRGDGGVAPTPYADMVELVRAGSDGLWAAERVAGDATLEPERLLAPLRPGKMLFCGVNYPDHAEENPDAVMPSEPFFFSKLPSALVGPGEPIVIPASETQTDYEVELAFVIGRTAKRVQAADALDHVFGYTVANDVSARDVQFRDAQITLGKNPDSFCPLGPELVTADELPDPSRLHVASYVNGDRRQFAATESWLFDVPTLIEFISRTITLEPGDLVTTGTPSGVAAFRDPPPWLAPGDEVAVEVQEIGRLTNPVVGGWEEDA
jgi:2,4-didehydro-3-deoxy-L-rhamnonate hydrolase